MAARDAARLIQVVVLPTPPFWFAIAIILVNEPAPGNVVTVVASPVTMRFPPDVAAHPDPVRRADERLSLRTPGSLLPIPGWDRLPSWPVYGHRGPTGGGNHAPYPAKKQKPWITPSQTARRQEMILPALDARPYYPSKGQFSPEKETGSSCHCCPANGTPACGNNSAIGTPGNPAPVPTSRKRWPVR